MKKKKMIIISILTIILLGGIIFAVIKFRKKNTVDTNVKTFDSEYKMLDNNLQLLDLYFLKTENEKKNIIYSPISIKYALAMLSDAASNDSKNQIDAVLGKYKPQKYVNSNNISFANAMFIKDSFKQSVKDSYIDLIKNKYNGEVVYDSFSSPKTINSWVSNKTFNLINNLLDDVSNNDFMLINALAIDMNWNYLIQPVLTDNNSSELQKKIYDKKHFDIAAWHVDYLHENLNSMYISTIVADEYPIMKFNNTDVSSLKFGASINNYDIVSDLGKENIRSQITKEYEKWVSDDYCEMDEYEETSTFVDNFIKELDSNYKDVGSSTDFKFYDDENVKAFAKSLQEYDGLTLEYVGIMPKKESLTDYIDSLKVSDVTNIFNNLKEIKLDNFEKGYITQIKGNIPLFKFDYELNLQKDLQNIGITDVFNSNANLSNLTDDKVLINPAIHKATIEFSNEGIKASAAASIGGFGSTDCSFNHLYEVPVKEIDLTFDKPFIFFIRNVKTGEIWFTGALYNP